MEVFSVLFLGSNVIVFLILFPILLLVLFRYILFLPLFSVMFLILFPVLSWYCTLYSSLHC